MEKEIIKRAEILPDGESDKETAEYYLVCDSHPFESGNIRYVSYGVGIQLVKDGEIKENTSLKDVFFSIYEAVKFIQTLAESRVTPCTLEEIVSDYLKECI